jgi:hypothetical protein
LPSLFILCPPPGMGDVANDRLSAGVDVNVFNDHFPWPP